MKKKMWTIIVIIVILIILVIVGLFLLNNRGLSSGGTGLDFSSGTKVLDNIGEATDKNSFDNVKLNPFNNNSG
ncbi:Uncharacterised protein [uncultured archaeon]|nr:Uncharacterised protein [uncultured archaeon]